MTNYKGKLQEYFQKKGISISELKYQIIDQKYHQTIKLILG